MVSCYPGSLRLKECRDEESMELRLRFYTSILYDMVHPLGNQDNETNIGVTEMINHVREIFEIDVPTHEKWLSEAMINKREDVVLKLTVVEAKDLKAMDANGLSDPYCVLSLGYPTKQVPTTSTEVSHPRLQKTKMKKYQSFEISEPFKTKIQWETLNPTWNEQYVLDVNDIGIEELHLYMWDYDEDSSIITGIRQFDKEHRIAGLRNIFRQFRQTVEHGKPMDDFLGKLQIPLRDIPSLGCDRWFRLQKQSLTSAPVTGDIRLQLQLSLKETTHSCERYTVLAKEVFKYNAEQTVIDNNNQLKKRYEGKLDSILSRESDMTLQQFAVRNGVTDMSRFIIDMTVVAKMYTRGQIHRSALTEVVQKVRGEITKSMRDGIENPLTSSLSPYVLSVLLNDSTVYIDTVLSKLCDCDGPGFFPPSMLNLTRLDEEYSLNITSELLSILHHTDHGKELKEKLSDQIRQQIEADAMTWISERVNHKTMAKKTVLKPSEMTEVLERSRETIDLLVSMLDITPRYEVLFQRFDLSYSALIGQTIDSAVSKVIQDFLPKLHQYQLHYQEYGVNILHSSKQSLVVYFAVKKLVQVLEKVYTERDKPLQLYEYSTWFQNTVIFWLQTFKDECDNRVLKALEMDPKTTVMDSSVNFSTSSVDVLCCFCQIIKEWNDIDYGIMECCLIGVTKVTEIICDGARLYTDNIQTHLQREIFHNNNDTQSFAIKDKICISLNNIERVRQYLHTLPELLQWQLIINKIAAQTRDSGSNKDQIYKSLQRHIKIANSDIQQRIKILVGNVADKLSLQMEKSMACLLEKAGNMNVDPLMEYLDINLESLYKQLMESLYDRVVAELWNSILKTIIGKMKSGAMPEYYKHLDEHLSTLESYFGEENLGLPDAEVKQYHYHNIKNCIALNSLTSLDLIGRYYENMATNVHTPMVGYGQIFIKMGYAKQPNGNVTLSVKVVKAMELRLDKCDVCSPYVVISLCPESTFPGSKAIRTEVKSKNNNPLFNEVFKFQDLSADTLTDKGGVLSITVFNQKLLSDQTIGEIFMPMSCATEIPSVRTVEVCPCITFSLKRQVDDQECYQILKQRSKWDKIAKTFIGKRQVYIM